MVVTLKQEQIDDDKKKDLQHSMGFLNKVVLVLIYLLSYYIFCGRANSHRPTQPHSVVKHKLGMFTFSVPVTP